MSCVVVSVVTTMNDDQEESVSCGIVESPVEWVRDCGDTPDLSQDRRSRRDMTREWRLDCPIDSKDERL